MKQYRFANYCGGIYGHWLRRAIHVAMVVIPIIYYWYGNKIAIYVHLTREQLLSAIIFIVIFFELIRLWRGWVVFGQRDYEARQISAAAWGAIGIFLVLIFAPPLGKMGAAIAIPLIWSLAIADPIMGEAKGLGFSNTRVIIYGAIAVALIWTFCSYWLGTPLWLMPILVPVTIAAEWPKLRWVDDNLTMLAIPLLVSLILLNV